jgi:hypothetical protein
LQNFKYEIGQLVVYRHAILNKFGIIVDREHDLYTRYKVQWFTHGGGINYFNNTSIGEMIMDFERIYA